MWSQPGVFSVFIILPFLLSYIWYDSCYICNFWQQAFNQVVQAVPIDDWYTTDTLPILDRQFTDILPTFYWCCRDRLSVDRTDGWLVIIRYIGRLVTTHGRYSTDTRPPLDQHPADISTVMATDSQLRCRPLRWWTPPYKTQDPPVLDPMKMLPNMFKYGLDSYPSPKRFFLLILKPNWATKQCSSIWLENKKKNLWHQGTGFLERDLTNLVRPRVFSLFKMVAWEETD